LAVHILQVFQLIVRVFGEGQMLEIEDGRNSKTNLLNTHLKRIIQGRVWNGIIDQATYNVDF